MKAIVAGVRREGSWKAYCRVEHKRLIRLKLSGSRLRRDD